MRCFSFCILSSLSCTSPLIGLSEDVVKGAEDDVQKLTDKFVKTVEDLSKAKESELMKV